MVISPTSHSIIIMALSQLDEDVFRCILLHLEPKELPALALITSSVAYLVQEVLFRQVSLRTSKFLPQNEQTRVKTFYKAIERNPDLGQLVRELDIDFLQGVPTGIQPVGILNFFPELRRLSLKVPGLPDGTVLHASTAWPKLQALSTDWAWASMLLSRCSFPQLKTSMLKLEIENFDLSPLITNATFARELQPFLSLQTLSCPVPGMHAFFQHASIFVENLSPARISRHLEPCRATLRSLQLDGSNQCWSGCDWPNLLWNKHDGSRLNLKSFPSLTNVRLPYFLLFKSDSPCRTRAGTYLLLPPKLEHLEVCFLFGAFDSKRHSADVYRLTSTAAILRGLELFIIQSQHTNSFWAVRFLQTPTHGSQNFVFTNQLSRLTSSACESWNSVLGKVNQQQLLSSLGKHFPLFQHSWDTELSFCSN
jgi:hypothetical protein